MISVHRERLILELLEEKTAISLRELAAAIPDVSEVTLRRDLNALAQRGLVKRTHGGALRVEGAAGTQPLPAPPAEDAEAGFDLSRLDAVILSPVEGRGALALRNQIKRMPIPFIAESAPQDGGIYLGPNNWAAGYALGCLAARECAGREKVKPLVVTLSSLTNTAARSDGFLAGLKETLGRPVAPVKVDGAGDYRVAFMGAKAACEVHPDINLVFGINDHSILAALDAAEASGLTDVAGYGVGGEGDAVFAALAADGALRACCALFPEVVGRTAINLVAAALEGRPLPREVFTPFAILTPANLGDYYKQAEGRFRLRPNADGRLALPALGEVAAFAGRRPVVSFMPHFPAHEWYRNMGRAMQQRAGELGMELIVTPPQAGIAREIARLRQSIADAAAAKVRPGEVILVSSGEMGPLLAEALKGRSELTVVTNSFEVLRILNEVPGIKVILTSGEYQARHRCLVGPSLAALFSTMRVDRAFLSVDGISARYGLSAQDERIARALQRLAGAAREVVVMADHTLVGYEASHQIAEAAVVSELITDSSALPAHRFALIEAGVRVTLADEPEARAGGYRPSLAANDHRRAGGAGR